ncbi:MAG TPA: hypothetical protein VMP11_15945 [Verrucomicrobiae bacterium]|nr:hypothetical protein [Verrucomicrobiae bacterium]
MSTTLRLAIFCVATATLANADVTWDITNSTYNGTPFAIVETAPGMGQAGSGSTTAYAGGSMDGSVFHMGFQSNPPDGVSTQNDDVAGTALDAGTQITLAFTKDASDYINYIAMNADTTTGVSVVELSPTSFTVSCTVVNPVLSASGDLGAAFGMGINIATNSQVDYGGSVFLANMCPGDISDPVNPASGAMTINARGINGVNADFVMYASTNWMNRVGMSTPALAAGYFSDTNGVRTTLPSGFVLTADGWYSVSLGEFTNKDQADSYCFELQNSDWSAHDLGVATITESASITVSKLQAKVNFAKAHSDSCSLTATLDLGADFDPTNETVTLDVSGADVSYTLDAKGKGLGISPYGSCKLSYNKKSALWTFTTNLKNGSWQTPWLDAGITNLTTPKAGSPISVPLAIAFSDGVAFTNDYAATFRATVDKSGTAK